MRFLWLFGAFSLALVVASQEHQRISAAKPTSQAVQVAGEWAWLVTPQGVLFGNLGSRISWDLQDTVEVAARHDWLNPSPWLFKFTGLGTQDNRRVRGSLEWIIPGGAALSLGTSVILDPVVLSLEGTWEATAQPALAATLSLVEVLNDQISWQLAVTSRFIPLGEEAWTGSLGVQWSVSWFSGPWSLESGVALYPRIFTGSGAATARLDW
jgi:hypothetical protein